ncbi:DegT/DnrJ/EryC1/StrS family aminotransferase [Marinobacter koreensis]|uniref:DegT/DnrJ/EryC1/StrS family aminotransferase n=1 Tax=Marinobacter koreensis TaxID=335974 RepID=UPI00361608D4
MYASHRLTNDGPLVRELTRRLEDYLGVTNLLLVANGTLAIQLALATLGVKRGRGLTTPFTFPATSSALSWQGVEPQYADIDPETLNLDPLAADHAVTADTRVILPVHTYGNPCDVERFRALANRIRVPLVYDASHAFGVQLNGQSLLNWGDAATLSLHATKLFHTAEGGGIVFRDSHLLEEARSMINFGLDNGSPVRIGINAKMSEMHAAMGLAVLEAIDEIIDYRMAIQDHYRKRLSGRIELPVFSADASANGAYMPVLCRNAVHRKRVQRHLLANGIESRAYFSPALGSLGLYTKEITGAGVEFADRILCLPIFSDFRPYRLTTFAILFVPFPRPRNLHCETSSTGHIRERPYGPDAGRDCVAIL